MHTTFAVATDGLPLGILDQNIFSRKPQSDELKQKKRSHSTNVSIEDKESVRWLNSLKKTQDAILDSKIQVVSICDREGDFYELFECAHRLKASVLIRAAADRNINMASHHWRAVHDRLWATIQGFPSAGVIDVKIPARDQRPARTAQLETRFGSFTMRIEVFHKILKSGLRVEQCRLQTADRLIRYLTVMSIIAWRIYWMTLIARTDPKLPCTPFFAEEEWKVLYSKIKKQNPTLRFRRACVKLSVGLHS